jgi:5-keto 4-deoxyuronate isomerase
MSLMNAAQRRRQYLTLVQRRVKSGSGSIDIFQKYRTAVQPIPNLKTIIKRTPFVIVGGIATRLYMPERMTLDLDILVLAEDVVTLNRELEQANCQKLGNLSIGGASWQLPDRTILYILKSEENWAREALQNPNFDESGFPVIALPYLTIMKLLASRAQDIADLTRMLGAASEVTLQDVRTVVQAYVPDALEDLESMIVLGRMELGL